MIFGRQLHVSYDDPIYDYLDCIETQGILPVYMNGSLPLSRNYIVDMLIHLVKARDKIFPIDIKILDEYLANYSYDLKEKPYLQRREKDTAYHTFQSWSNLKTGIRTVVIMSPSVSYIINEIIYY